MNQEEVYSWYRPRHQVVIAHNKAHQWCMFLAVPEALVLANLDRVLIPRFAFVGYFSGEVRAKDVFAQDYYAARYLQKYTPEPEFKEHQTHLVSTFTNCATRPGVGGSAFFSNGACRQSDRWFDLFPNFLWGGLRRQGRQRDAGPLGRRPVRQGRAALPPVLAAGQR